MKHAGSRHLSDLTPDQIIADSAHDLYFARKLQICQMLVAGFDIRPSVAL